MSAHEILAELRADGVVLRADHDRLHVDAPPGMLTAARRAVLAARKDELLGVLKAEGRSWLASITRPLATYHCAPCGAAIVMSEYDYGTLICDTCLQAHGWDVGAALTAAARPKVVPLFGRRSA